MTVKTVTSDWASENSWSLGTCVSEQTYQDDSEYNQDCCLEYGVHTLTCKDSYGDGWNGAYIEIEETQYCDDFDAGFEKTAQIIIMGI